MKNRRIMDWDILLFIGVLSFFSATSHAAPEPVPVLYKATVRIKVVDQGHISNPYLPENPYFLCTQIEIIQSKPMLYEVANRLNLAEEWSMDGKNLSREAVHKTLKKSIHVYQQRDTTLIAISAQRSDPAEAAKIANEIAETFRDYRLEVFQKEKRTSLALFETVLKEQRERVAAAEKKVEELGVEYKIPTDRSNHVDAQNVRLLRLENERHVAHMEITKKKACLKILKDHAGEDLIERASFMGFDQMILNIIQKIQDTEDQIASLEADQGSEHPELKRCRLQKEKLEKVLARRLVALERTLQSEYKLAEAMFGALDKELDDIRSKSIRLHKEAKPYRAATIELESDRFILKHLETKLQEKLILLEIPRNPVEIISPAKPPADPPFSAKRGASYNRAVWVRQGSLV